MDVFEMERLIAGKFLGWKETEVLEEFIDENGIRVNIKHGFSNYIEWAWKIAEKMKVDWEDFSICNDEGLWNVTWGFDGYGWRDVSGENVPMVLCIACLQSIGIQIEMSDVVESSDKVNI